MQCDGMYCCRHQTALCIAASEGYKALTTALVEAGADLNLPNSQTSFTPLHRCENAIVFGVTGWSFPFHETWRFCQDRLGTNVDGKPQNGLRFAQRGARRTPRSCEGARGGRGRPFRHEPTQEGEKTSFFAPFIYKMHYFTKTGSGQT